MRSPRLLLEDILEVVEEALDVTGHAVSDSPAVVVRRQSA